LLKPFRLRAQLLGQHVVLFGQHVVLLRPHAQPLVQHVALLGQHVALLGVRCSELLTVYMTLGARDLRRTWHHLWVFGFECYCCCCCCCCWGQQRIPLRFELRPDIVSSLHICSV
jgi:hypothetical protein